MSKVCLNALLAKALVGGDEWFDDGQWGMGMANMQEKILVHIYFTSSEVDISALE